MVTGNLPYTSNRSLQLAYERTASAWFPVNPSVLENIRTRLSSGYYKGSKKALVKDIKSDLSLYLYCLRELQLLLENDETSEGQKKSSRRKARSLSDLAQYTSMESLSQLIHTEESVISTHSIEDAGEMHAYRLRESLLSTCAVETLAEKLDIDTDCGFTCALLRQLGLTLIAWNYPGVYRRTLSTIEEQKNSSKETLDSILHTSLGFTPAMLGARFAYSWKLSDEVIAIVNAPEEGGISLENLPRSAWRQSILLEKLCTVGEALARVDNSKQYPQARADWDSAEAVFRHHLGPDGIKLIYNKAKNWEEQHKEFVLSTISGTSEALSNDSTKEEESPLQRNTFLRGCPKVVQRRIAMVYDGIKADSISQEHLRLLVHKVIPSLGFESICVFMLDPTSATLNPTLKLGNPRFIKAKPVGIQDYRFESSPISSGYWQEAPFVKSRTLRTGESKKFIIGGLGENKRVGMLYLEMAINPPADIHRNTMIVFRALVQCFNDLLHLN